MNEELKALEESAKATQEIAKTTSLIVNTGKDFAGFVKAPFETVLSIWDDNLKFRKWKNQVNIIQEAKSIMKENNLEPTKKIPLKFAIPLLEASSLEDDKYLQDLWRNLLINSSTKDSSFTLEKSYINVLEQLSTLEAQILITIYRENYKIDQKYLYEIKTYMLPDNIEYSINDLSIPDNEKKQNKKKDENITEPSYEVKLALSNLSRLQCIKLHFTFGGTDVYNTIKPTLFGAKLYQAVKDI